MSTKNLSKLSLGNDYRTGSSDPATNFYRPCLKNSIQYDRAVGYFRSSIYLIVGDETVDFARNGGKIRLICSPLLQAEDAKSIQQGYAERERALSEALLTELEALKSDFEAERLTRILATLIASDKMDVRIAIRPDSNGIYHEKIGIFTDALANSVSFIGSANETWNAWHREGNFESIEVFCQWKSDHDAQRVARHRSDFERLWRGEVYGLEVYPFPQAARESLLRLAHPSLDEIPPVAKSKIAKRSPLPHQLSALEAWAARGRRGILEHATGSGKTFTALTAILDHAKLGFPTLVLVPSQLLLEQWAKEIGDEIPDAIILLAGNGNISWKNPVKLKLMTSDQISSEKRIVLSTMQTAATMDFRSRVIQGNHLMLVVDEVHQVGSAFNSKALEINAGPRLGLSATPKRYGDPEGTRRIFDYFGGLVPPPFTLQDAIKAGRLVEYEYFPHSVHLNATETEEWKKTTAQIRLEVARSKKDSDGRSIISDKVKMMLIKRSRISKKAANKVRLAADILKANFIEGQRWLVYCEDSEQLDQVRSELLRLKFHTIEYHSAMLGERHATLDWFKDLGGVLVSIKCLDEGIDIPEVDCALVLASSQNPRQFIQRRGRVLRKSPGKTKAIIHDAIVTPLSLDLDPEQRSLLTSELRRAVEFSKTALNRSASAALRSTAIKLGLDLDTYFEGQDTEVDDA